jgi:hypothetical protein
MGGSGFASIPLRGGGRCISIVTPVVARSLWRRSRGIDVAVRIVVLIVHSGAMGTVGHEVTGGLIKKSTTV